MYTARHQRTIRFGSANADGNFLIWYIDAFIFSFNWKIMFDYGNGEGLFFGLWIAIRCRSNLERERGGGLFLIVRFRFLTATAFDDDKQRALLHWKLLKARSNEPQTFKARRFQLHVLISKRRMQLAQFRNAQNALLGNIFCSHSVEQSAIKLKRALEG